LLDSQPFIPSYFGFNVDINKAGAEILRNALADIPFKMDTSERGLIVDTRTKEKFKKGHLDGSINIQATSEEDTFETWLGSIVEPEEEFHLVIESPEALGKLLERVARVGYENQLKSVFTLKDKNLEISKKLNLQDFKVNPENYTIIDVRNKSEVEDGKFFANALSHPLNDLRYTVDEIPTNKPLVVHCAGGYRSAAGASILENKLNGTTVYDLSDKINDFE